MNSLIGNQGITYNSNQNLNLCNPHGKERNIIVLKKDFEESVICFKCQVQQKISQNEVLPQQLLLQATEHEFLPNYPILDDPSLLSSVEKIEGAAVEIQSLISEYFGNLKKIVNDSIQKSEQQAKDLIRKLIDRSSKTLEIYHSISQIDNFKRAFTTTENDQTNNDLKQFIQDAWKSSSENTKTLQDEINEFNKITSLFNKEKLDQAQSLIMDGLELINFAQQNTGCVNSIQNYEKSKRSFALRVSGTDYIIDPESKETVKLSHQVRSSCKLLLFPTKRANF